MVTKKAFYEQEFSKNNQDLFKVRKKLKREKMYVQSCTYYWEGLTTILWSFTSFYFYLFV